VNSRTILLETPRSIVGINKTSKIEHSRRFASVNSAAYFVLRVPNASLLNRKTENAADKIIPAVDRKSTAVDRWKIPAKIRTSPMKFGVPGKLIFARLNTRKAVANNGMTVTRPP